MLMLVGGVIGFLIVATLAGLVMRRFATTEASRNTIDNLNARMRAWWAMAIIFGGALFIGRVGSIALFGMCSFWALREFITLTPTRPGDHRVLFWAFFVITPLHYYLLSIDWYGLFIILIPVYAFLLIPTRNAISGDCERFLERTAKIQWALMICVYCVSHAPALLYLHIFNYAGQNGKLLFYFVFIVEMNDVLQYVWGKTTGRHKIAPIVSPNKTWEGFIGGTLTTTLLGAVLHGVTPFTFWQAAGMSLVITLMGFAGGLTMSAIKRDRGVKDFGASLPGHGGVLDRLDSLSFAAPVFYHLTRFFFT